MNKTNDHSEENIDNITNNQTSNNMADENSDKAMNNDNLSENSDNTAPQQTNEETCEEKLAKLHDDYLRLHAEFDNYRKRTIKEKAELLKSGTERVLTALLPVIDDFERAIQNIHQTDDVNALKEGVEHIYNKFQNFLKKNGVEPMDTNGKEFNAEIHEALTMVPAPTEEQKNKIIDTVEKGYTLEGKVMRYPKVVVGQ